MSSVDSETLSLFHAFCKNLYDVDREDEDFEGIVTCAWQKLHRFAQRLGPDFVKEVETYWTLAPGDDLSCCKYDDNRFAEKDRVLADDTPETPEEFEKQPQEFKDLHKTYDEMEKEQRDRDEDLDDE